MKMATSTSCSYHSLLPSINNQHQQPLSNWIKPAVAVRRISSIGWLPKARKGVVKCGKELQDFVGGDLLKLDLGKWLSDIEEHKALAIYSPHEGGYEGRYLNRLRYQGYDFLDLSARGLGDPETTLTKVHPVCPVLSKAELQFLALLPSLRPNVRIIAECGNWRKFMWRPLKEMADLPAT